MTGHSVATTLGAPACMKARVSPSQSSPFGHSPSISPFAVEQPLTTLVWITSLLSIVFTYAASNCMIPDKTVCDGFWCKLSTIISCGTLAAALIPEVTKFFTSS